MSHLVNDYMSQPTLESAEAKAVSTGAKLPETTSRLAGIDGLRGLAALVIVVYHTFCHSGNPEFRVCGLNILRPFHDGWCGVNLFLVLSGLCLYWPYASRPQIKIVFPTFMKKRALRILPAYYAALIVVPLAMIAMKGIGVKIDYTPKSVSDFSLHLLMLHSLTAESYRGWYQLTWSLGLEWLWYLVFPLAVVLFRKLKAYQALLLCGCLTLIYRSIYWSMVDLSNLNEEQGFVLDNALPGRLFEFAAGMFVADFLARGTLPKKLITPLCLAVPTLLVISRACESVRCFVPVRHWLYCSAFAILALLVASKHKNIYASFMRNSWFEHVGEYSYSLYLFHLPLIVLVCAGLTLAGITGPTCFCISLFSIPLVMLTAKICYELFEKPFLPKRNS